MYFRNFIFLLVFEYFWAIFRENFMVYNFYNFYFTSCPLTKFVPVVNNSFGPNSVYFRNNIFFKKLKCKFFSIRTYPCFALSQSRIQVHNL
jgi:hypothetical protein